MQQPPSDAPPPQPTPPMQEPSLPSPQQAQWMPPGAPARAKKGRGCFIVLATLCGLGMLTVAFVGFGIYRYATSPEGRQVFGAMGDALQLAQEAQHAPGAKEVAAIGCDTAMAMDMDKMMKIMHDRLDAGSSSSPAFSVMVVCQMQALSRTTPTCDDVAKAYLGGAGPPSRGFVVNVQRATSSSHPICSVLYDPSGTKVKDMAAGSTPTLPGTK